MIDSHFYSLEADNRNISFILGLTQFSTVLQLYHNQITTIIHTLLGDKQQLFILAGWQTSTRIGNVPCPRTLPERATEPGMSIAETPDSFKPCWLVKKYGHQGVGLFCLIWLYWKLLRLKVSSRFSNYLVEMYLGWSDSFKPC